MARFWGLWLSVAYAALFSLAGLWSASSPHADSPATFVGSGTCTSCHAGASKDWKVSQHAAAMQEASDASVLGRFDGAAIRSNGRDNRFFKRDGRFFVATDGPDGKPGEFEIRYTFGVYPLQQYLIALPGGRLQAFGIAWDARLEAEGGQRWFNLYPHETLTAGDTLHWTGRDQNWNHQCASCHSTDLKKSYDLATKTFATTWSEISVGCEACHGPASKHLSWAKGDAPADPRKGFAIRFDERSGVSWVMQGDGQARRSSPRATSTEIDACAACHSRREQFAAPTGALFDAFRPARLDPGLYWPDGQQKDEVFTYGSFLHSRMHHAGVTCSDCHNPHSGKLRENGNALCGTCHALSRFDTASHHHHAPGSNGSACIGCHMPATVYMGVDARHDHSFRIPRPDLTQGLGVPNACEACHADKSAASLAESVKSWSPHPNAGYQTFAKAFDRADHGAPGAVAALLEIVRDPSQPAIVRRSAIARLAGANVPNALYQRLLQDSDPGVRLAALELVETSDLALRAHVVPPLLSDPARAVRMEAARALSGPTEALLDAEQRKDFEAALAEYVAGEETNADRPEAHLNLASLFLARGLTHEAETALARAREFAPAPSSAFVMLSEVKRAQGDERAAEAALREGLRQSPDASDLRYALGLSLVRQARLPDALAELLQAASAKPSNPRYAYTGAIALHESGRVGDAVALLENALLEHPYDRGLLSLLAGYRRELSNSKR